MITIFDFQPGERFRFLDFGATASSYRRQLLSFGLTQGVEIQVIRIAPLGCPVQILIRGTHLAFRKEEARYLQWERL